MGEMGSVAGAGVNQSTRAAYVTCERTRSIFPAVALARNGSLVAARSSLGEDDGCLFRDARGCIGGHIAIDHALHSSDIETVRHTLLDAAGSDHLPLRLGLRWGEPEFSP